MPNTDPRIILTLDAGGGSFRFAALRGGVPITEFLALPPAPDALDQCLANLVEGFSRIRTQCPEPPVALSFAFPGPADYPAGIIGDAPNFPAFRGGVALGPMLEERFGLPVFINNDGNLFAFGEAIGGFLPYMNGLLEKVGCARRYHNLVGLTLGTGLGGGIVLNRELLLGDNSIAGEIWLSRNKLQPDSAAEEGASARAVRRVYAELASVTPTEAPEPRVIAEIAAGRVPGNPAAAREAFRRMGEVAGDAVANALTLIDGLAVIGGGLSGAWPLFLPALMDELNGQFSSPDGHPVRRLASTTFNLEDPAQLERFLQDGAREVAVPQSRRTVKYDAEARVGIGISRLGTSQAVALGAYTFALRKLDERGRGTSFPRPAGID